MFQKIFTNKQLSLFFQIAVFIELISLMGNLIVYHYFPSYLFVKELLQVLNELGLFIICFIVISQILLLLTKKYTAFIHHHTFISLHIAIIITMVMFWILALDNDIQEEFIIFLSKTSLTNHSYELTIILLIIFIVLIIDFYHTLKEPETINEKNILEIVYTSIRLLLKEHFFIFVSIFGIFHIQKINQFALNLFHYTQTSAIADVTFLEILIPISWILACIYYIYNRLYMKHLK